MRGEKERGGEKGEYKLRISERKQGLGIGEDEDMKEMRKMVYNDKNVKG